MNTVFGYGFDYAGKPVTVLDTSCEYRVFLDYLKDHIDRKESFEYFDSCLNEIFICLVANKDAFLESLLGEKINASYNVNRDFELGYEEVKYMLAELLHDKITYLGLFEDTVTFDYIYTGTNGYRSFFMKLED